MFTPSKNEPILASCQDEERARGIRRQNAPRSNPYWLITTSQFFFYPYITWIHLIEKFMFNLINIFRKYKQLPHKKFIQDLRILSTKGCIEYFTIIYRFFTFSCKLKKSCEPFALNSTFLCNFFPKKVYNLYFCTL